MSVLILEVCTSYMECTASLICRLLARTSTRNTSVLISSIFFIADSVVTGQTMIRCLSNETGWTTDLRGYFGSRGLIRVFGRKKCTFRRTFLTLRDTAVFKALETLLAFFSPLGAIAIRVDRSIET